MQRLTEQQGRKIAGAGQIRHPDERAHHEWMVKPGGGITRVRVANNVRGGVLYFRGEDLVLDARAHAKGWRYVADEMSPKACVELDDWHNQCESAAKRKAQGRPEPPGWYRDIQLRSKIFDDEPEEGLRKALAAKRRKEQAELVAKDEERRAKAEAPKGAGKGSSK